MLAYLLKSAKAIFFGISQKDPAQSIGKNMQAELDQKLVLSLSKSRIPKLSQIKHINRYLTRTEFILLYASVFVFAVSSIFMSAHFYVSNQEVVPKRGGEYREGAVGAPKHINPLYSGSNDVDSDISRLVFSSLFRRGKDGQLQNDLAESYAIGADGKSYSVVLKKNVKFHDGSILTSNDVYFTFNAIKDAEYASPLRGSFAGVEIEIIDDYTFNFHLASPYAAFLELLTFGILPADIWSLVPASSAGLAELNLKPIGSGPFKYEQLSKEKKLGTIKEYKLAVNDDYFGARPYLDIVFKFYGSYEELVSGLNSGEIDGASFLPNEYQAQIVSPRSWINRRLLLPQISLLFFNQAKNPLLADKNLRQALAYAIDKNAIIKNVLGGNAQTASGPIPAVSFAYDPEIKKYDYSTDKAMELLKAGGWENVEISEEQVVEAQAVLLSGDEKARQKAEKIIAQGAGTCLMKGEECLKLKITAIGKNENLLVLEAIKGYWQALNIRTEIEVVDANQIQAKTIKPRDYEILFYGQLLGADPDPYFFWHSSQANGQGFNLADYNDKDADKLLEDARLTNDAVKRQGYYKTFQAKIAEDLPAIFMYSPFYTYLQSKDLQGFAIQNVFVPSDRLGNISDWYMETEKRMIVK